MRRWTMQNIPVYIVNLKKRTDRKKFISREFLERSEFDIHFVKAIEHHIGAIGLWNSIISILKDGIDNEKFIVLCEDDHQFTPEYSKEGLYKSIEEAESKGADILSGGISGFTSAMQVSDNMYWVEKFSGLQFTVIFQKFFSAILNADFEPGDAADYKICSLTDNKFFLYPFISTQKDFGYSDATPKNNKEGRIDKVFNQSETKMLMLKQVSAFYKNSHWDKSQNINNALFKDIMIPTYVINLPERKDRRDHIEAQFKGKDEFNVRIIEACKHQIGAKGLWLSIRIVIKMAIQNEDDVIIICEDDHEFTKYYSKNYLLENIIRGHEYHVDLLSGGVAYFNTVLPVTSNLFWVNEYYSTQFIIVYRKFFKKILDEPFDDKTVADGLFSEMTANKMLLYPFVSVQKEFGYSDCTLWNNQSPGLVETLFLQSGKQIGIIQKMFHRFYLHS